jgi:acyl carrier protein
MSKTPTERTQAVLSVISSHVGKALVDSDVTRRTELSSLGISSVTFLVIVVDLEDALGEGFEDPDALAMIKTVDDLLRATGCG